MSESRGAERDKERKVATRKPWGERLKCGRKGGVIRGSFALQFVRERKAMVRNGSAEQSKKTKDSPRAGWLGFVSHANGTAAKA
jgi:hypothetical protein